jgi:hypothetical protein
MDDVVPAAEIIDSITARWPLARPDALRESIAAAVDRG